MDRYFDLLEKGILITIFSYKDSNKETKFRGYFKDLNSDYLYNPLTKDENGKLLFPVFDNVLKANEIMQNEAYKYLENDKN